MAVIGALSQMTQSGFAICRWSMTLARLVGFVSIGDLVKYQIDKIEAEAAAMRDYIAGPLLCLLLKINRLAVTRSL